MSGVTQLEGRRARKAVTVGGVEYVLKKDATDAAAVFPYQRMAWINAGCDPLSGGRAFCCWIHGIIPPTPGTLERPVSVFAIGFHAARIAMTPATLGEADLQRMHFYTSDGTAFAQEFVDKFLGSESPADSGRDAISPFPPEMHDEGD